MNADSLDVRLLRFRSKRDEAPHTLAAALLAADRVGEALEVVHAGLLDAEDDADLLVLEGRGWFAEGDLPQAQAALLRAAKVQPTHADAYRWLSQVLMKRGEPHKAVRVLERAAKLRPDDSEIASALARARRLSHIAEQADSGRLSQPPAPHDDPPPEVAVPPAARVPGPPERPAQASRVHEGSSPVSGRPEAPTPSFDIDDERTRPSYAEPSLSDDSLVHALVDSSEVALEEVDALEDEATGRRAPALDFEDERPTAAVAAPLQDAVSPEAPKPRRAPEDDLPTAVSESPAARASASALPAPAVFEPGEASRSVSPAGSASASMRSSDAEASARPQGSAPFIGEEADFGAASSEAAASGEADDSFEPAYVAPTGVSPTPAPPEPAESMATGEGAPGEPEPPERVLEVVKQQGLFEGEAPGGESAWVPRSEARREGTRVRKGLAIGWAAALVLAGGGYYGWTRWVEHRHDQAAELLAEVKTALADGDPGTRARAEAALGEARQLDPRAEGVERVAVLLQAMHALEDGELDVGYLRPALARLEKTSSDSLIAQLSNGIVGLSSGNAAPAKSALAALDAAQPQPDERYLAAALALRLGTEGGQERLESAAATAGVPRAVFLQGVADAAVGGNEGAALAWLERAREAGAEGRRTDLWQALLTPAGPADAMQAAARESGNAATTDGVLLHLATARRAAREGDRAAATAAVLRASELPVRDPQLLALTARVASEVGAHDTAYAAARGALQTAPENAAYRDAMVRALLARGDGEAVERALSSAPADAPWVVVARARSALLTGNSQALRQAAEQLPALTQKEDDPELAALALRVELRLGRSPRVLLGRARRLAHAAGENGRVALALGETALAARDARTAVEALEKARAQLADSGELLAQLAQAYRMAGEHDKARAAFERAVQVAPELTAAKAELARMALARGDYEAAEKGFAQVTQGDQVEAARVGRVEALIGLGRLLDARDALAALPAEQRRGDDGLRLQAKLLLAMGELRKAEDAVEELLDEAGRSAPHLTLYGDVLFADDEVDKAAGAYDAALEEDGSYPEALVGRARAAVRAEKTDQAYRWLDAAEKSLDTRTRPPEVRARLLTARGMAKILDRELEGARSALSEAVQLAGVPPEAYFWLGEAQALTKQAGARESYERYLELAPQGDLAGRARRALKPR